MCVCVCVCVCVYIYICLFNIKFLNLKQLELSSINFSKDNIWFLLLALEISSLEESPLVHFWPSCVISFYSLGSSFQKGI